MPLGMQRRDSNDGTGRQRLPRLRLADKLRRPATVVTSDNDSTSVGTPRTSINSMRRTSSTASSPRISVTVDLPTLRPGSGAFTQSPSMTKRPMLGSVQDRSDDEGEEEDDDDEEDEAPENESKENDGLETNGKPANKNEYAGLSDEKEQGDNFMQQNVQHDHQNHEMYYSNFKHSGRGVQITPSEKKTEFFMKETADLLNHRNKLLGELHFTDAMREASVSPSRSSSASPSPSMTSVQHASKMVASPSDMSVLAAAEPDGNLHQTGTAGMLTTTLTHQMGKDCLLQKFPELTTKQIVRIRNRAKHVSSYFETYYKYIEEYQRIHEVNDDGTPRYPGVDGIWNPLQIMRNRRVRMRHGEKLSKVNSYEEWRKVHVACKNFSKRERSRLIWYVGLNEIVGDIRWREYNNRWLDMRDREGKRWFSKHHKGKVKVAMKDVVRELTGKEGGGGGNGGGAVSVDSPTPNTSITSANVPHLIVQEIDASPEKEDKNGTVNAYGALVGDEGKEAEFDYEPPMKLRQNGSITAPGSSSISSAGDNLASAARFEHYKRRGLTATGSGGVPTVNTFGRKNDGDESEDVAHAVNGGIVNDESEQAGYYDAVEEVIELVRDYRGILGDLEMCVYSASVREQVCSMTLEKRSEAMKRKVAEIEEVQLANREKYEKFNRLLESAERKIDMQKRVIQTRSTRIEELLGFCDRTNGEIITSITLKIRNLNEIAEGMSSTTTGGTGTKFIYRCVEAAIVCVLWMVWIIVETWLWLKWIVTGVVRTFTWILRV
ncbi:hypothetical protein CANINC_004974 [Pichia inconspicua]|uniref:Uncharacterized protein n=1 Tax=Pichia inconspicua TaxID=52247 RepID=A0A4T0WUN3_9ASCO|nr:hypothetical protein CANINC_004974 [[Candida] inconspicua]